MTKAWQRKYQRAITTRLDKPCSIGWARSLCQIILFYAEKHPEARVDKDNARNALEALCNGSGFMGSLPINKLSINRDKSGFKMEYRQGYRTVYLSVSNYGLPPVVTSYETLTN